MGELGWKENLLTFWWTWAGGLAASPAEKPIRAGWPPLPCLRASSLRGAGGAFGHSCSAMLRGQVANWGARVRGWGEESAETLILREVRGWGEESAEPLICGNATLSPRRGAPRRSLELQSLCSLPSDRSDWDGFTKKEGSRTDSLLLSSWAVWPSD